MASNYWSPAIVFGSEIYYLPPGLIASFHHGQSVELISPALATSAVLGEIVSNQGSRVSLSLDVIPDERTAEAVLAKLLEVWQIVQGQEFTLFLFSDRGLANCAVENLDYDIDTTPLDVLRDLKMEIVSASSFWNTDLQLTFTDYGSEYPYASEVGRPEGDAATPGEEIEIVQPSIQVHNGIFPGVNESATTAGEEHVITVGGTAGSSWLLKGMMITSANPSGASGTSTVRVSTAPIGSSGSNLNATVLSSGFSGAEATGSIAVTQGDALYIYIPSGSAGGHSNLQYRLRLQAV